MKVVSPKKMSNMESQAYQSGSSEADFMEEAGSGVALVVHDYAERYNTDRTVIMLCGKGNNAGDAYVAGIYLINLEYEVIAIVAEPAAEESFLCKHNRKRFMEEGGQITNHLAEFPKNGIILDGLFGTGFHGELAPPYPTLVKQANESGLPIIAIDIPSGLHGDTGLSSKEVISAKETAFLGLPKTGFFLHQGWNNVGVLRHVDFGLPSQYIENVDFDLTMLSFEMVKPLLPKIKRNRHKYEAGYVVGLAGSPGMPGASNLSSSAAQRGGAGIVKLLHPKGMEAELASSPYELIKIPYQPNDSEQVLSALNQASAVFIGPGMGRSPETRKLLKEVLPKLQKPSVIDADALTILSEENIILPKNAILTPHLGEMMRLLKITDKPDISLDFLKECGQFAEEHGITLILKGAPTFIFHPGEPAMVNPTGDPGMATAGSGDVLTGLLAALLAQGLSPQNASALGVFLHGLAGEHAADEVTSYGVIASDIIYHFPEAFRFIRF